MFTDTIERIHVDDITVEEFIEKYERASRPCIIQGVTENWIGKSKWTLDVGIKLNFINSFLLAIG